MATVAIEVRCSIWEITIAYFTIVGINCRCACFEASHIQSNAGNLICRNIVASEFKDYLTRAIKEEESVESGMTGSYNEALHAKSLRVSRSAGNTHSLRPLYLAPLYAVSSTLCSIIQCRHRESLAPLHQKYIIMTSLKYSWLADPDPVWLPLKLAADEKFNEFFALPIEKQQEAWLKSPHHVPEGTPMDLEVSFKQVPVRDGAKVGVKIYRNVEKLKAMNKKTAPLVLVAHGGGWVLGNHDVEEGVCRWTAKETAAVVVDVDYRL